MKNTKRTVVLRFFLYFVIKIYLLAKYNYQTSTFVGVFIYVIYKLVWCCEPYLTKTKNRANIVSSILSNGNILEEVKQASENAEGSSQKELNEYLDSIEGRISNFTNEIQEFWHGLIDPETIKFFITSATTIVDAIGEITGALGELGTIGLGAGIFAGAKNFGKYRISVRNFKIYRCLYVLNMPSMPKNNIQR